MYYRRPRITIAALKGGSGKTIVSLGLIAAWKEMGRQVAPFKKGPDFIDAGWLTFAADRLCYNLDMFLMNERQVFESFLYRSQEADLAIIEGNRGLFDGLDVAGRCSTGELAKLLQSPVIIVVDVTMATRTMAAIVKGCQVFDPHLQVCGVILNRVASPRQETLIRQALETYCDMTVVGAVPKLRDNPFPERHMGLVPHQESRQAQKAVSWAKKIVCDHVVLEGIWKISQQAQPVNAGPQVLRDRQTRVVAADPPRIGVIRDTAFWFYYPENLEQLKNKGAHLVELSATSSPTLPPLDALYIGGGFPETQVSTLANNRPFCNALRGEIEKGLPVYAECGGLLYLGQHIVVNGQPHPMVGALPVEFVLEPRPQGHGYTILEVVTSNPYYAVGDTLRGHEFHYSKAVFKRDTEIDFAFKVLRGFGLDGRRDGILKKNLLATYSHVHAAGNSLWAEGLISAALGYFRDSKEFFKEPAKNN